MRSLTPVPTMPSDQSRYYVLVGHEVISKNKSVLVYQREHSIRFQIKMRVAPASPSNYGRVPGHSVIDSPGPRASRRLRNLFPSGPERSTTLRLPIFLLCKIMRQNLLRSYLSTFPDNCVALIYLLSRKCVGQANPELRLNFRRLEWYRKF